MTTQATRLPEIRKPSFLLKDLLSPVTKFIVRVYDAFVEARQLQAAMETAQHLKAFNKDFKHMSYNDIIQQIMSDIKKDRE
jgi:hypothetical protein